MPFTIQVENSRLPHLWGTAVATCNLNDEYDRLIKITVDLVRRSYGENAVVEDAETLITDDIDNGIFELNYLRAAIREGLPDPDKEGNKPQQLTNYRSQSAEMVAKLALAKAYSYQYPVAPQEGTGNPNQPILGFDGWGILEDNKQGLISLALIQVKATDVNKSPPDDSITLANECRQAPTDRSSICRALTTMCRLMRNDPLQIPILKLLEKMGRKEIIPILVSPVVVRGITKPLATDLEPIMEMANEILPAYIRAIVVSIGVQLNQFGELIMRKAREATI